MIVTVTVKINIIQRGNRLRLNECKQTEIMSGSKNRYILKFDIESDFFANSVNVLFEKTGCTSVYYSLPVSKEISLPNDFYKTGGTVRVSLFGDDRITTHGLALNVTASAYDENATQGSTLPDTPDNVGVATPSGSGCVQWLRNNGGKLEFSENGAYKAVTDNNYTAADKTKLTGLVNFTSIGENYETLSEFLDVAESGYYDADGCLIPMPVSTETLIFGLCYVDKENDEMRVFCRNTLITWTKSGSVYTFTETELYGANKVDKEAGKGLFSGSYTDLTNKPTLGALAAKSSASGSITPQGTVSAPTITVNVSVSNEEMTITATASQPTFTGTASSVSVS